MIHTVWGRWVWLSAILKLEDVHSLQGLFRNSSEHQASKVNIKINKIKNLHLIADADQACPKAESMRTMQVAKSIEQSFFAKVPKFDYTNAS